MVNELNNTISEAVGKLEKIVAIIESLKFSIQDGMDNISDETQNKKVLEALDKFTDIQKSNFKLIQAIGMLGSDMKLNLNALYPILPADVLRAVLGEQNNYEDLPEDLVSKIMGDESNHLNDSPVDDSIQKVSDEKNENDLMSQIMELAPKTESEAVTTPTEATPEATSEVATPPVEATPEATSEVATPPLEATPEATSEVATPPVEATPEATSEVTTPPVEATPEATSEVAAPPTEATPEATSETPNELDSIVLPSLDETPAENTTVESTSSPNTEDTVLLPLNDENNGTVAEASTENTADSFELLPLEVENPVNDKAESVDSNVVLSLDSTNLTENKNDDSMVGGNELVLPVLQQSLDIDKEPKADIASLDTSPVHAPLSLIQRGDSKILAVTSAQFSNLENSFGRQVGNPEIARVLNFPSQDNHESSLGVMIQESKETTASLENEKETDLETMMQEMEKAYSEGRVDEAERLSAKISEINAARQKTLTLSNAA